MKSKIVMIFFQARRISKKGDFAMKWCSLNTYTNFERKHIVEILTYLFVICALLLWRQ
jgi:hypothetical protein